MDFNLEDFDFANLRSSADIDVFIGLLEHLVEILDQQRRHLEERLRVLSWDIYYNLLYADFDDYGYGDIGNYDGHSNFYPY